MKKLFLITIFLCGCAAKTPITQHHPASRPLPSSTFDVLQKYQPLVYAKTKEQAASILKTGGASAMSGHGYAMLEDGTWGYIGWGIVRDTSGGAHLEIHWVEMGRWRP